MAINMIEWESGGTRQRQVIGTHGAIETGFKEERWLRRQRLE